MRSGRRLARHLAENASVHRRINVWPPRRPPILDRPLIPRPRHLQFPRLLHRPHQRQGARPTLATPQPQQQLPALQAFSTGSLAKVRASFLRAILFLCPEAGRSSGKDKPRSEIIGDDSVHSYSVQFRISGTNLVPTDISRELGLNPNQIRIAGEDRKEGRTWDTSLWSYDGSRDEGAAVKEWESLELGLQYLLAELLPKMEIIRSYIGKYDVCWWCGHFQSSFDGGPTFSPSLLRQLAEFGVPLYLDNYFSNDEEDDSSSR
jgi:hypothetical protein